MSKEIDMNNLEEVTKALKNMESDRDMYQRLYTSEKEKVGDLEKRLYAISILTKTEKQ